MVGQYHDWAWCSSETIVHVDPVLLPQITELKSRRQALDYLRETQNLFEPYPSRVDQAQKEMKETQRWIVWTKAWTDFSRANSGFTDSAEEAFLSLHGRWGPRAHLATHAADVNIRLLGPHHTVVFDGTIADLLIGMLSRCVSSSPWFSVLADERMWQRFPLVAGNACAQLNAIRHGMNAHRNHLQAIWDNGFAPEGELHPIEVLLPQMMRYMEVAIEAVHDPVWRHWWQAPYGANRRNAGAAALGALMTNDGTPKEKAAVLAQIATLVPADTLRTWWKNAPHKECLQRGLFSSWMAVAQGCGISEEEAIAQKDDFVKALMERVDQPHEWKRYVPVLRTTATGRHFLERAACLFWDRHHHHSTPRQKDPVQGWRLLQQLDLAPATLGWAQLRAAAQESDGDPMVVRALISNASLNEHLHEVLQPTEQTAIQASTPKRKM